MDEVDESSQCEVKEFKGFKKSEMKPTVNETSMEEEEENSKDVLPNGTDAVPDKKEDSNKTEEETHEDVDQEMSVEEEEEEEEGDEEDDGNPTEEIKEETPEENENSGKEDTPKEEAMEVSQDTEIKDKETKATPGRERLRSSSSDTPSIKKSVKKEVKGETNNTSSDEEDFLGFDVPAMEEFEKDKSIRSSVDEPESLDSDAGGTPYTKSQTRGSRSWKKSVNVDLSNPEYRKPFEHGWVRELVYRSTSDSGLRRHADIYYFTPKGKKVRSFREVAEHLTGDLTVDNFTFFKDPIGIGDPDKEIIREAKAKPSLKLDDIISSPVVKKLAPKLKTVTTPKANKSTENAGSKSSSVTPRVVFKGNVVNPKNKTGKSKFGIKGDKKRKSAGPDDMEIEMIPAGGWSPELKAKTNGVKRLKDTIEEASSPPPQDKKQKVKENSPQDVKETKSTVQALIGVQQLPSVHVQHHPVVQNFMMNLNAGFSALLHAFQYLKVHELLRASCVSHMWHHIAQHRSLWETVRMKNSRVRDWDGFGRALSSLGTRNLDLKKMLLPESAEATSEMWVELSKAIARVSSLRRIDLGKCTPEAVESIALSCPQLESIISLAVRGNELNVTPISSCTKLTELKLKSIGGIDVKDLTSLKCLTGLKHLSLTTIKNLAGIEEILSPNLETLELGECSTLSKSVATTSLPNLVNLRRLRLEKGMDNTCPTTSLLNTIASLPNLTQLELINFDVKPGFDKALAKCTNLKTLLIIPTYVTQSATTNHVVIGGVSKLSSTLTYFVWGLTLELLRVTDLFIDQVEGQKGKAQSGGTKKGSGDSIPILKPIAEGSSEGGKEGQTASQVDILALPKLQKVLSTLLPSTKIKILKVPFSATWRQTVSEVPQ